MCVLLNADKKVTLRLKLEHQVMWVRTPGTQYGSLRLGKQSWENERRAEKKEKKSLENVKATAHALHPSHREA